MLGCMRLLAPISIRLGRRCDEAALQEGQTMADDVGGPWPSRRGKYGDLIRRESRVDARPLEMALLGVQSDGRPPSWNRSATPNRTLYGRDGRFVSLTTGELIDGMDENKTWNSSLLCTYEVPVPVGQPLNPTPCDGLEIPLTVCSSCLSLSPLHLLYSPQNHQSVTPINLPFSFCNKGPQFVCASACVGRLHVARE
jgi:hypothetical protein